MVGLAKSAALAGALYFSIAFLSESVTDPYSTSFVGNLVQSGLAILAG